MLDAGTLAIELMVERSAPPFIPASGDRHPNAMVAQPAADAAAAVAFVGTHTVGAPARTTAVGAANLASGDQRFKHETLVAVTRLERKGKWPPLSVGPHAQFGRESAVTASEGFGRWIPFFAPAAC